MKRRGQSAFDYAVFIAVAVSALAIMGFYLKNTLSAKWRNVQNVLGEESSTSP
jgi:hypothetical protein